MKAGRFTQNLWKSCGKVAKRKSKFPKVIEDPTNCTKFGHYVNLFIINKL